MTNKALKRGEEIIAKSSPYEIRKATLSNAEGTASVHVKGWQTSYAGIIEQTYLDAMISYDERLELCKKILNSKDITSLNGFVE